MIVPSRRATLYVPVLLGLLLAVGCTPAQDSARAPRLTLVVGIDVSGSFRATGRYEDALDFAAYYIHAHLNGLGEMEVPSSLFVGSVGGEEPGEAKSFHPIHDFQGKSTEQIGADLREWFPAEDRLTDFNAFFSRTSDELKRRGLVLTPLNIVLLTDGIPDLTAEAGGEADRYAGIDVNPLEYLSRSVTVRVLYPESTVAVAWEQEVKRRRVRLWTTDATVMEGWRAQLEPDLPADQQAKLWGWIRDNVDFRVRRQRIF